MTTSTHVSATPPPVPPPAPPLVLYLPALPESAKNTSTRVAETIAVGMNRGPGTYIVEEWPATARGRQSVLLDRHRITGDGNPVLDICTVDYRPGLRRALVPASGLRGVVREFFLSVWYFARALVIVLDARRRAKSRLAKVQLLIGFGTVTLLFLAVLATLMAVLVALDVVEWPEVPETVADATALGMTGLTVWIVSRSRPVLTQAVNVVRQVFDYAHDQTFAATVGGVVDTALDEVLTEHPARDVHVVGYSFGSLVAMDYLFPRFSSYPRWDARHRAVASLTTIGCPLDFVRLYVPRYDRRRCARLDRLPWRNVYIAADVLGSNFVDGQDVAAEPRQAGARRTRWGPAGWYQEHRAELRRRWEEREARKDPDAEVDGLVSLRDEKHRPESVRYTDERLSIWNVWSSKGLVSHGGYWSEPEAAGVLHPLVTDFVFAASAARRT